MEKETVTLEIFKIHSSFRIDFQVLVSSKNLNKVQNSISKFTSLGNTYLRIVPVSYIIIDIQSKKDKKEIFNPYGSFSMGRKNVFRLITKLKNIMRKIRDPDLEMFFLYEGKLMVDTHKAEEAEEILITESLINGTKHLHIFPSIVEDNDERYEGVCIFINNISNRTFLTFTELEMVINVLSNLDFSLLSLKLLNTYILLKQEEAKELEFHKSPLVEQPDEVIHNESIVIKKEETAIPEI